MLEPLLKIMDDNTKVKCPECDGCGEVHSHNPICWECNGTGIVTQLEADKIRSKRK